MESLEDNILMRVYVITGVRVCSQFFRVVEICGGNIMFLFNLLETLVYLYQKKSDADKFKWSLSVFCFGFLKLIGGSDLD